MIHEFRNSQYLSQFATFFIVARAQVSVVNSCNSFYLFFKYSQGGNEKITSDDGSNRNKNMEWSRGDLNFQSQCDRMFPCHPEVKNKFNTPKSSHEQHKLRDLHTICQRKCLYKSEIFKDSEIHE